MPSEDTDLERRVLAHERILKALISQLAAGSPDFLDNMNAEFGLSSADRGYQHDYTGTAEYADEFMRHVTGASLYGPAAGGRATSPSVAPAAADAALSDDAEPELETSGERRPTAFEVAERNGIWRVRRDDVFYGDYHLARLALDASTDAALEIEKKGGKATILFG